MSKPIRTTLDFGNGSTVTGLRAPVADSDGATKGYVDSAVEGLSWKEAARVATVSNITLSGPGAAIDGITLTLNDRVLVKDQTDPTENGLYIFNGAAVTLSRAPDAATFENLEQAVVSVEEGSSAGTTFRQTEVNGVIDTNNVVFSSFGTAAPVASETTSGTIEIATQPEVDAGSDSTRAVTPQTLDAWSGRRTTVAATIGDGAATSYNIDHNLATRDVQVSVVQANGVYADVIAHVTRPSVNRVTVEFDTAPAIDAYRVLVSD